MIAPEAGREGPVRGHDSTTPQGRGQMTTGQGFGNEELVLYERLFGATDSALTVVDTTRPSYPILWANPAFEQSTGWSLDEVSGRDARFFLHEQDPAAARGLSDALEHGRAFRGSIPARRRDGRSWVDEVSVTPMRDARGELRHSVLVHEDVSEHSEETTAAQPDPWVRARDDRRRVQLAEGLARSVLDSLEQGVVLFGEGGEVVEVNESALRIFGLREVDAIGRTVDALGL